MKNKKAVSKIKTGLFGEFKLEKYKNGQLESATPFFHNHITDMGIYHMMSEQSYDNNGNDFDGYMCYCYVGTGTSEPSDSDQWLEQEVAGAEGWDIVDTGYDEGGGYIYQVAEYRFEPSSVIGEISEVMIGSSKNQNICFSRELIRDTNGNPTTFELDEGTELRVYYQFRIYVDLSIQDLGQFTINGTPTNVSRSPVEVNEERWLPGWGYAGMFYDVWLYASDSGPLSGDFFDDYTDFAEEVDSSESYNMSIDDYVISDTYRTYRLKIDSESGNFPIQTIIENSNLFPHQYIFNPPIEKTDQQSLILSLEKGISRY